MHAVVENTLAWIEKLEKIVVVAALATMLAVLAADVIGREFFAEGLFGSVRVGVYALILCAMAGFGLATAGGSHLRPKFMDGVFSGAAEGPAIRLGHLVSAMILLTLVYASVGVIQFSREIEDRDIALGVLVWPFQVALPLGFGLSALRHLAYAVWPDLARTDGGIAE